MACEKEHCKETKTEIVILKLAVPFRRDGEHEKNTRITFLEQVHRRTEIALLRAEVQLCPDSRE